MRSQNISSTEYKLGQIRSYILDKLLANFSSIQIRVANNQWKIAENNFLFKNVMNELFNIQTVGLMWNYLFQSQEKSAFAQNCLDNIVEELFLGNVVPTVEEMAECDNNNRNAWFLLSLLPTRNSQPNLISVLLEDHKIYPRNEDLNRICKKTNTSSWYELARNWDDPLFLEFLTVYNCIPSAQALNAISKIDNVSVWFHILDNTENNQEIISNLFKQHIYPTYEALSCRYVADEKCEMGKNGWYVLFEYLPSKFPSQFFEKGIIPKREDLDWINPFDEAHGTTNADIWCILLGIADAGEDMESLNFLLDNNILPSMDHYKNFLQPKIKNLADVRLNCPIFEKANHIERLITLEANNFCNNKLFVTIFSRHDVAEFYGFFYLFYSMLTSNRPVIDLPLHVWIKISKHLSVSISEVNLVALKDEFIKVHLQTDSGNLFFKPPFLVAKDQSNLDTNKRKAEAEDSEQPLKKQKRS